MTQNNKIFNDNSKVEIVGNYGVATRTMNVNINSAELVVETTEPFETRIGNALVRAPGEITSIKLVIDLNLDDYTNKFGRINDSYESE